MGTDSLKSAKKRIRIAFSGGLTSAYMTKHLLDNYSNEYEFLVTFANTSQENEKTLEFVHNCDKHFGFKTVWLEAVVNPIHGKGTTHKVVTFETANRDGAVFESYIAKDGVPNITFPHCTRELKQRPMDSYTRSLGWKKGTYEVAIGIRTDETRRVSRNATKEHIIYPLVDMFPADKQDVREWWEEQDFNLGLLEHQGNCTWCWKKSLKKHALIWQESPEVFDFPNRMEETYGHVKGVTTVADGGPRVWAEPLKSTTHRVFFRGYRSTKEIISIARDSSPADFRQPRMDENSGCSESCEVYAMEETT